MKAKKLSLFLTLKNLVRGTLGALVLFFCFFAPIYSYASNDITQDAATSLEPSNEQQETVSDALPQEETPAVPDSGPEIPAENEKGQDEDNSDRQSTDYSCGPAALAAWIKILGGVATEAELIDMAKTNAEEGTTFLNLKNAAIAKGYANATVYRLTLESIGKLTLPALVYLNVEGSEIGHYAVLYKVEGDIFYLIDPQEGKITKTKEEFVTDFGEYAMINGTLIENIPQDKTEKTIPEENVPNTEVQNPQSSNPLQQNEAIAKPVSTPVVQNSPPAPKVASDEELTKIKGKGLPLLAVAISNMARFIGVSTLFVIKYCKFGRLSNAHTLIYVSCLNDTFRVHIDNGGPGHVPYRHIHFYFKKIKIYTHRI